MFQCSNGDVVLEPFFTFYGGKWRSAPLYDSPRHDIIVEPFAGSAGYSLRYPHLQVVLVEIDPVIAATWRYLTEVSEREILSLPDIAPLEQVDDLDVCQEAKYLIGWWCGRGAVAPGRMLTAWGRDPKYKRMFWGDVPRQRIASQLKYIRHWLVIEGSYENMPQFEATWFVDPPYRTTGRFYKHGSRTLDYERLAQWILGLSGQVIVCEGPDSDWLPFQTLTIAQSNKGYASEEKVYSFQA